MLPQREQRRHSILRMFPQSRLTVLMQTRKSSVFHSFVTAVIRLSAVRATARQRLLPVQPWILKNRKMSNLSVHTRVQQQKVLFLPFRQIQNRARLQCVCGYRMTAERQSMPDRLLQLTNSSLSLRVPRQENWLFTIKQRAIHLSVRVGLQKAIVQSGLTRPAKASMKSFQRIRAVTILLSSVQTIQIGLTQQLPSTAANQP